MVEMNLSPPKLNFGDNIMDSNTLNIAHFLYMDYGYFLTKNDLAEVLGVSLSTINRRLSLGWSNFTNLPKNRSSIPISS